MWPIKLKSGNKVFIVMFLKKSFSDQSVPQTTPLLFPFLTIEPLKQYILLTCVLMSVCVRARVRVHVHMWERERERQIYSIISYEWTDLSFKELYWAWRIMDISWGVKCRTHVIHLYCLILFNYVNNISMLIWLVRNRYTIQVPFKTFRNENIVLNLFILYYGWHSTCFFFLNH
jgi:hypothetical protein